MEQLRLKPRNPVEEVVEDWDDGDFVIGDDNYLPFRSQSTSSTNRSTSKRRRDSHSSFRSDRESLPGDERQVHLPGDDENARLDAIAAAAHVGIPIPVDVPPSALVGGSIKRLDGRKIKEILQDDWSDELESLIPSKGLRLRTQIETKFPEALRQVSGSTSPSPAKKPLPSLAQISLPQIGQRDSRRAPINLEKFRDTEDDDDIFGDGATIIKASKLQVRGRPTSSIAPPVPSPPKRSSKEMEEDMKNDPELPSDGKLKLSSSRDIPKTPAVRVDDDSDWGEGSLGTRFGGTKRDTFYRSPSVPAMSPSITSSITAESEDDFEGLIFPMGSLDLDERLKRRKQDQSPDRPEMTKSQPEIKRQSPPKLVSPTRHSYKPVSPKAISPKRDSASRALQAKKDEEDLMSGVDFGEGNIFRYAKPTVHRNVKVKEARPMSPARPKAAVSITFTSNLKSLNSPSSRIPRPMASHERSHTQSSLEPVSESGGPIPPKPIRRPQSRLSGHSAHSSVSSVHTSAAPSTTQAIFPPTLRRKEVGQKASTGTLRAEPTTTSAQLLRLKRSLPALRHTQSSAKLGVGRSDRPPSRGDSRADAYRPQSSLRPKTPVERPRPAHESGAVQARKGQVPFLPAGASLSQSRHVNTRASLSFRRHDSKQGPEPTPLARALSRNAMRSASPRRLKNEKSTPEPAWQQMNKPRRVRHFGDGHELDAFDDLPTSAQAESRYLKQPVTSGNKANIRNKLHQNVVPGRNTPSPVLPNASSRSDTLPHFARDTAASRIARETSLAQRVQPSGSSAALASQRAIHSSLNRSNLDPQVSLNRDQSKKSRKPRRKPHLISNLIPAKDSKVVNGMTYNPETFSWDGNDKALNGFEVSADVSVPSPTTPSVPQPTARDKDTVTPRPVLITNINTKKETRRMGDMVFDPQDMRWVEINDATLDEDDPFKDIPDLKVKDKEEAVKGTDGKDKSPEEEWPVGEEFDLGPEFIKRQHEEEARWRRKLENWAGRTGHDRTEWRWMIHDIVMETT